jgi:hypothetical protein
MAMVVSTFLALLATVLETILTDYRTLKLEEAEFIQDWGGNGRIVSIDARSRKLKLGWLQE